MPEAPATLWAGELNPLGLSQGDIVTALPIGTTYVPITYMGRNSWPRQVDGVERKYLPQEDSLVEFPGDTSGLFLARGRILHSIVISHSCEIDNKPDRRGRVVVAPIASLAPLEEKVRDNILGGERRAFMPLRGIPNLGDYYADLRNTSYLDRKIIGDRMVSMNNDGVAYLQIHVIAFFSRLKPEHLADAIAAAGIEGENA
jgi:hypothetical protein